MPNLYIIAGSNGAGKTTVSNTLLPEVLNCKEFVNADNIAIGLSPFDPEHAVAEAEKLMLDRIDALLQRGDDLAFETTLASKEYIDLIKKAHEKGFKVILIYLWLSSALQAKQRVALRESEEAYNITDPSIERRFQRGITNLQHFYLPVCDVWMVVNNSLKRAELVSMGEFNTAEVIYHNYTGITVNASSAELKTTSMMLRDKIMPGIHKAHKKLLLAGAEKNREFSIANAAGEVRLIAAKEILQAVYPELQ